MKDLLQEHPEIFVTGQFKAKVNDVIYLIIGFEIAPDGERFYRLYDDVKDKRYIQHIDDLTLIARPIEDMTDEEKGKWKSFYHDNYMDRMIPCYANQTAYLLSIGVYPFDQKAFDDGTVIDSREV